MLKDLTTKEEETAAELRFFYSKKLVFFFVIIVMMTFFVSKNKVYKRVIRVKNVSRFNDQLDYLPFASVQQNKCMIPFQQSHTYGHS